MTTVAVTGASGPLGRALLERLDADRQVARILAVDLVEPPMPVAKLEFRTADVRDPLLPHALRGADVVVHLAHVGDGAASEDDMFAVNVHGTRNVLRAADKNGVRRVVVRSSAVVYGAHPDNPLPLDEDAPLRANSDYPYAHTRLLAEELVAGWSEEHPSVVVTVLRSAAILDGHVDTFVARYLESPRLPVVRGYAGAWQFAALDDVAAALHLAATRDLPGVFNVASEGWLSVGEVAALLGRKVVEVPEQVAVSLAQRLGRRGLLASAPAALHYLTHPWVVSCERLRAHGWAPAVSNRQIVREFADATAGWFSVGRWRVRRRDLYVAAFATAGTVLGLTLGGRRRAGESAPTEPA